MLAEHGRLEFIPDGAFYFLVDVERESVAFAHDLLTEHGVAVAPGTAFGEPTREFVRVSLCASEDHVRMGLERICEMVGR